MDTVNAYPTKQFFLEMFTRDISLEDCVLDLIDNSIDSLIRLRNLDIEEQVFGEWNHAETPAHVTIKFDRTEFRIEDNCGGISRTDAENDVFCFGHRNGHRGTLGVYGIGLKRAIFKIGDYIEVESRRPEGNFKVIVDVPKWAAQKSETYDDWRFPIVSLPGKTSADRAGTKITITKLHKPVLTRLEAGSVELLGGKVAQAYSVFLERNVQVSINGSRVKRHPIPWGGADDVDSGKDGFEDGGVKVILRAALAPRDQWVTESAGWYVLCNGRMVVSADRTELTGWGDGGAGFHSKYRGFVGVALFLSADPFELPWTTSKRGLNREARVFQIARNRMRRVARPVLSFLNKLYPSDPPEAAPQRALTETLKSIDFQKDLRDRTTADFRFKRTAEPPKTRRVIYEAEVKDLERVRKRLRQANLSPSAIGKHTFNYFLKMECPE